MFCNLRFYNSDHPTCRSCISQGANTCKPQKQKKVRKRYEAYQRGNVLVCTKDLRTPNDWTNKEYGKRIYRGEREAWKRLFRGAFFIWGKPTGRRRLTVTRYVPGKNHFMKDRTNIEGSMKPLEDALVNMGILIDDKVEFLHREEPRQEVDKTFPRVEIEIEDM